MTGHLRGLLPAVLVAGALAGAVLVWRSEGDRAASRRGEPSAPQLQTPVLSPRRTPELAGAPVAERQLLADLQELSTRLPPHSCLAVRGPGLAFDHRADEPLIPASAQKLITATAALEVLGPEPAVLDQVERALRDSDDPSAEALFDAVGGAEAVSDALADLGAPRVVDGTGHSRGDRVTCALLVDVLLRPGTGEQLRERLAVAGESGTLASRFLGTDLVGILRAKTGSLTSVLALAGVVEDDDPPLTFALVVNTEPGTAVPPEVEELQREVAEALARWPEVPVALGPEAADG